MKGLLHSKRFRKNLRKWLFMYIGVMALLTTVVTYSRYITSKSSDDIARAAKFNVKITRDETIAADNCETKYDEANKKDKVTCETGTFRPTSNLEYIFNVDTSEIEVNTDLYLTIDAGMDFELVEIHNLTDPSEIITISNTADNNETKKKIIYKKVDATTRGNTKYKVIVKYAGLITNDEYIMNEEAYEIIKVSYAATQRNN